MKKFLVQATCVLVLGAVSCWADAMHGYCGGSSQCLDNNTNSPTTNNPPTDFGFTINKGGTGNLRLEILIPNNADPNPSSWSFDIIGTLPGTATLFSGTPWTSGFLDAYLGISARPSNPIAAYLGPCTTPCTSTVDPGATGFFVYQANFPTVTLQSHPNISPLFNFASTDPDLPIGSFITGFFNRGSSQDPEWVATSNSSAIFEDGFPPVPPGGDPINDAAVPEPSSIALLSGAILGSIFLLKRKVRGRA